MLRQVEMSFFGEIRVVVKCVQGVTVELVFARDIVTFVSVFFTGTGKEAHICLHVLVIGKIWFQRLDRLSVSIQV